MGHLFEFIDLKSAPESLKKTLHDILALTLSKPFRGYNLWVAQRCGTEIGNGRCTEVHEMGAGSAPITQRLSKNFPDVRFVPSDENPDWPKFSDKNIHPEIGPVAFSDFPKKEQALVVVSAALHHLPGKQRYDLLKKLSQAQSKVLLFEPFRRSRSSWFAALTAWIPAVSAPWILRSEPGQLRRVLWCWLIPLAPLCFVWDSLISVARQWSSHQWQKVASELGFQLELRRNCLLAAKV